MSQRKFSVAQANSGLSRVIRHAEQDGEVALTRHGQPIAVLLSMDRYRKLVRETPTPFVEIVEKLRTSHDLAEAEFDPEEFLAGIRQDDAGRDFEW